MQGSNYTFKKSYLLKLSDKAGRLMSLVSTDQIWSAWFLRRQLIMPCSISTVRMQFHPDYQQSVSTHLIHPKSLWNSRLTKIFFKTALVNKIDPSYSVGQYRAVFFSNSWKLKQPSPPAAHTHSQIVLPNCTAVILCLLVLWTSSRSWLVIFHSNAINLPSKAYLQTELY